MNKAIFIGNLTRDPELRTTQNGVSVCNFTLAVNRRVAKDAPHPETDYVRVTCWRALGEHCHQYLYKGSKCCVWGTVSAEAYQSNQDGSPRCYMTLEADNVEFLNRKETNSEEAEE